ncbi:MAG: type II secretion system protein H [Parasphingorhabdus sp.]|jgi:type II secretion system protein H
MSRDDNLVVLLQCRQAGFTLLEMMLVVALIAITVTFVNLNIEPDQEDLLSDEAERVAALIRHMEEESVLTGQTMAIEFNDVEQTYSFLQLQAGEWQLIENDDLLRTRHWRKPVKGRLVSGAALQIAPQANENSEEDEEKKRPQLAKIVVDPVGEIFPFNLKVSIGSLAVFIFLNEFNEVQIRQPNDSEQDLIDS